jgi:AraC-like DNA-binding protein
MYRSDVGKPRGILHRTDEGDERFDHFRGAPAKELREHVAHFWMVRWRLAGSAPVAVGTLPHPSVHVTVEDRRAVVGGVRRGRFSRTLSGDGMVFGVKFRPGAFQPIYGRSMAQLTDRTVPIAQLFGRDGARYARAIRVEPDFDRCVAIAEKFFAPRLPPLDGETIQLRDLVERMSSDRELLRVEQVAEIAGMDLRRLQRGFRFTVGVTPKWVIQRYRLCEAAARLAEGDAPTLAALAQELGYFDQAHFIRDFKAVVGRSPGMTPI